MPSLIAKTKKELQKTNLGKAYKNVGNQFQELRDTIKSSKTGSFPQYSTGARAYIVVNGSPLCVAMSVSWSINSDVEEIRTIDTNVPWDIHHNQISVRAQIRQLVDPSGSAEEDGLWATMSAIIHQPLVELEITDASGSVLFKSRGTFNSISNTMMVGSITERTASFVGQIYLGNVSQNFKPYKKDAASFLKQWAKKATSLF